MFINVGLTFLQENSLGLDPGTKKGFHIFHVHFVLVSEINPFQKMEFLPSLCQFL